MELIAENSRFAEKQPNTQSEPRLTRCSDRWVLQTEGYAATT